MRLHNTIVLSLSALTVLALAGCSTASTPTDARPFSASAPARQEGENAPASALLSSAALSKRLLDESDLGEGYARKPQQPERHDDVAVSGCPALDKMGGAAAAGGSLDFLARRRRPLPMRVTAIPRWPRSCTAVPKTTSRRAWAGSSRQ